MAVLVDIIDTLKKVVKKETACCAILSPDCLDESSLMGTREGLLNLAIAILQLVNASETHGVGLLDDKSVIMEVIPEKRAIWSDNLKKALHQLPGNHPFIVGTYVFEEHEFFIAALEEMLNPLLPPSSKLRNDPAFNEP